MLLWPKRLIGRDIKATWLWTWPVVETKHIGETDGSAAFLLPDLMALTRESHGPPSPVTTKSAYLLPTFTIICSILKARHVSVWKAATYALCCSVSISNEWCGDTWAEWARDSPPSKLSPPTAYRYFWEILLTGSKLFEGGAGFSKVLVRESPQRDGEPVVWLWSFWLCSWRRCPAGSVDEWWLQGVEAGKRESFSVLSWARALLTIGHMKRPRSTPENFSIPSF